MKKCLQRITEKPKTGNSDTSNAENSHHAKQKRFLSLPCPKIIGQKADRQKQTYVKKCRVSVKIPSKRRSQAIVERICASKADENQLL